MRPAHFQCRADLLKIRALRKSELLACLREPPLRQLGPVGAIASQKRRNRSAQNCVSRARACSRSWSSVADENASDKLVQQRKVPCRLEHHPAVCDPRRNYYVEVSTAISAERELARNRGANCAPATAACWPMANGWIRMVGYVAEPADISRTSSPR
jgi:hypothetical protein